MSSAMTQLVRAPLAAAGTSTLATEYKRKLKGYPWWKQIIFDVTRMWLRFCDTRLHLPTIIHHDKRGDFTIDYCGTFDDRELALAAIAKMKEARETEAEASSQFQWQDLPRNGLTPEASGRYFDSDFPNEETLQFQRANRTVRCPFNGSQCNPDETAPRSTLNTIVKRSQEANDAARNLKQLIT